MGRHKQCSAAQFKNGTFPLQRITAFMSSPFIIDMNCLSGHHTVSCKNTNLDLFRIRKEAIVHPTTLLF